MSLIELLMAISILAVGFIFVLGMFPSSIQGIKQGKNLFYASRLAQWQIEKVHNLTYEQVQQLDTYVPAGSLASYDNQTVTFNFSADKVAIVAGSLDEVRVQVSWQEKMPAGNLQWKNYVLSTYVKKD